MPLLLFGFALAMLAGAIGALLKQSGWGAVIGLGLFGAFVLWMAVSDLATLRIQDRALRIWGLFRYRQLEAEACAFGVRLQSGSRSSRFIVFATDGQASADVGDWGTERGARRGIERLSEALYGDVPRRGSERAEREVEQVERTWKATLSVAQKTVDSYYQSPAWRRGKYTIVGLIVAYAIGMLLYQYFSGQL